LPRYTIFYLLFFVPRLGANPSTALPLAFERNAGQSDSEVKFLTRGQNGTLWLTEQGPVLSLADKSQLAVLRLRFQGGNRSPKIEGVNQTGGVSNYFIGNDPAKWHTHVPQFEQVRYRDVYPGIDVVFYGKDHNLEYDFVLRPGADPSKIQLKFDGQGALRKDSNGDLVFKMGDAEVRNHKPVILQAGRIVGGEYVVTGKRTARFTVGLYDRARPLVIDPVMTYGTLLGGNGGDQVHGVAMDEGFLYAVGTTSSTNFPGVNALFPKTLAPGTLTVDAFVVKINPSKSGAASVVFSTIFGGTNVDEGTSIGVDASGSVVIAGETQSFDFPLKNAFSQVFCGAGSCAAGFVAKFSPLGDNLLFSSYLGGEAGFTAPFALAMDAYGNAWLTGLTTNPSFPIRGNAFQSSGSGLGHSAGFISEVSPSGSLNYSTYVIAPPDLQFTSIAIDSTGNVIAGGFTTSTSAPVTAGAFQTSRPSPLAGFVVKIDSRQGGAAGLLYGTYLGGSVNDVVNGIAVDASGSIYAGGYASSPDFPVTSNAARTTSVGTPGTSLEGFVSKLNPAANGQAQLVYSTFVGGNADDAVSSLKVDSSGRVTVTGVTHSTDLAVTPDALQCCYQSSTTPPTFAALNSFLARLDPSKSGAASLLYMSYLGGSVFTQINQIAIDSTGNNVVAGGTVSAQNTPLTQSAFQSIYGGEDLTVPNGIGFGDAYIASFNFATTGPAISQYENGGGLSALPSAKIAPGLVFTVKGNFGGPPVSSLAQMDPATGRIATKLEGVQVLVNGIACPLTYVSNTQINAIAPYELASNPIKIANVQVIYNGVYGNVMPVPVAATAPGILSFDDGTGQGAILNQDQSINGAQNAAAIGTIVTIFATGEGQTSPPGVTGGLANNLNNLPHPVASVSVTIGGVPATDIRYSGTAPQEVYGLFQVNVTIPTGVTPGSGVPVVLKVGGVSSQAGLTMAVK